MWIQGDASSLRRLFLILIDNAVKYTYPKGQVEVSLQRNNGYAVAQVRDTGIGIAESDLPNVFERFYRADKARTRESGGVGLGYPLAAGSPRSIPARSKCKASLAAARFFRFGCLYAFHPHHPMLAKWALEL